MFSKLISELTATDIEQVVKDAVQEGQEVEFKETLPAKDGKDGWLSGADRLGDRARNEIVEGVIAFSNAYGGTLIVGIGETREKPARAERILPIPRCVELADRLRLMCRDCIDPQLPMVEVSGITMQKDGAGVVVLRVPSSRSAPHRHTVTRECYIRRDDRSERMTMREIQDLTLHVERGLADIEARFRSRQIDFRKKLDAFKGESMFAFGIRVTLQPLNPIRVDRIHRNEAAKPPLLSFRVTIGKNSSDVSLPIYSYSDWKPILRGSRDDAGDNELSLTREVFEDGLIQYSLLVKQHGHTPLCLYPAWFAALVGNALCSANRFRLAAGAPHVEFGFELEILNDGGLLTVGLYGGNDFGRRLGPLPAGDHLFPRYSIGSTDEFQNLVRIIEQDFWNACGHDWGEESLLVMNFSSDE